MGAWVNFHWTAPHPARTGIWDDRQKLEARIHTLEGELRVKCAAHKADQEEWEVEKGQLRRQAVAAEGDANRHKEKLEQQTQTMKDAIAQASADARNTKGYRQLEDRVHQLQRTNAILVRENAAMRQTRCDLRQNLDNLEESQAAAPIFSPEPPTQNYTASTTQPVPASGCPAISASQTSTSKRKRTKLHHVHRPDEYGTIPSATDAGAAPIAGVGEKSSGSGEAGRVGGEEVAQESASQGRQSDHGIPSSPPQVQCFGTGAKAAAVAALASAARATGEQHSHRHSDAPAPLLRRVGRQKRAHSPTFDDESERSQPLSQQICEKLERYDSALPQDALAWRTCEEPSEIPLGGSASHYCDGRATAEQDNPTPQPQLATAELVVSSFVLSPCRAAEKQADCNVVQGSFDALFDSVLVVPSHSDSHQVGQPGSGQKALGTGQRDIREFRASAEPRGPDPDSPAVNEISGERVTTANGRASMQLVNSQDSEDMFPNDDDKDGSTKAFRPKSRSRNPWNQ